jgi:excisionase family DNA binding protein
MLDGSTMREGRPTPAGHPSYTRRQTRPSGWISRRERARNDMREECLMDVDELPAVVTVAEVAKLLRISRGGAYELVRSGQIYAKRIGRSVRVPRSSLRDFLERPGPGDAGHAA